MPTIEINLREIDGLVPTTANLKNARIDFSPYRAYADDEGWVSRNIVRVKAPEGLATPEVPATPTGNAYEVQERGFRGARHGYVLVPDVATVAYKDLVWVNKDTLEPDAQPEAAWVVALDEVDARSAAAEQSAAAAQTGLATKVNASTYTSGMAAKADVTALTSGLATKANQTDLDAAYSSLNTAQGNLATALTAVADLTNTKADAAATTTALGTKADATATTASLATKASTASVAVKRDDPWRFDSTRGRAVKAALAKRATTPVDIVGMGASWMAGSGAGATAARWWDLAATAARTRWPAASVTGGRGYRESYSFTPGYTTPFTYSTTTGANAANANFGLGRKTYVIKAGNTVTFTLAAGETGARVLYGKGPTGGNFSWQKNGGTAMVVSGFNATAVTATLDLAGVAGDVFLITATVGLYFQGAYFFGGDETKGVRMWNGGTSGYRTADFIDATGWTYDTIGVIDPDLFIIDLGANDYSGGTALTPVSVATYKANLATLVSNVRTRCAKPPTVLLQLFPQITNGSVTTLAPWADYRTAALEWAATDGNVGVWDLAPIFGSMTGTDTYGITAGDLAHPNASGYAAIADQFVDILSTP